MSKNNNAEIEHILRDAKKCSVDEAFDMAGKYHEREEYEIAFKLYSYVSTCENPNPLVYFNLGAAYQFGLGTEVDPANAFKYYEEAAKYKLPQALQNLAYFYQYGIIVNRDIDKAEALIREATIQLENLQTELRTKTKEYDALKNTYNKLLADYNLQQSKMKKSASENAALSEQVVLTQKANDSLNEKTEQQKKAIDKLLLEASEVQKNFEEHKTMHNDMVRRSDERMQEKNRQLNSLQAEKGNINGMLQKTKSELDAAQKTIEAQRAEIASINNRKPFMKKRNVLRWIDIFLLVFHITISYRAFIVSEVKDTRVLAAVLIVGVLFFIIEQRIVNNFMRMTKKFTSIKLFFVELCMAFLLLASVLIWIEHSSQKDITADLLLYIIIRIWNAFISFKKEIY